MNTCGRCGIVTTFSPQCGLCIALQHDHDRLMEAAIIMLEWNGGERPTHMLRQPHCKTCAAIRDAA